MFVEVAPDHNKLKKVLQTTIRKDNKLWRSVIDRFEDFFMN